MMQMVGQVQVTSWAACTSACRAGAALYCRSRSSAFFSRAEASCTLSLPCSSSQYAARHNSC